MSIKPIHIHQCLHPVPSCQKHITIARIILLHPEYSYFNCIFMTMGGYNRLNLSGCTYLLKNAAIIRQNNL